MSGQLHIGTSGWSYKHWQQIFYPVEVNPAKYLEYYFTRFNCVELNSSFYHLPLKSTVEGWLKRTPENFIFCPKLSRYVTHQLRLVNTDEAVIRFFDIFKPLKSKTGPVLIQLPPGLTYDPVKTETFLNFLKNSYGEYQYALEIRNKSWIVDEVFDQLQKYQIAFAIADSGNRFPHSEKVTAGFIYLRFHGNGQLYASDYSETELDYYSSKISGWLSENKEVWVFFNNDIHGYAINNALRLKALTELKVTSPHIKA